MMWLRMAILSLFVWSVDMAFIHPVPAAGPAAALALVEALLFAATFFPVLPPKDAA